MTDGATDTHRLAAAERFIWLTARVLEQRRFEYLFGAGTAERVAAALEPYRCSDGGYGYALDPDMRGPVSQPLGAHAALSVLGEIGRCTPEHAAGIVDQLVSITGADGGVPVVDPSLRDHPHPPFMPIDDEPSSELLSTALLAGELHRHSFDHTWLPGATEFCWRRIDALTETHPYEAHAAVAFLDHVPDRDRAVAAAARLGELVREQRIVALDPENPDRSRLMPGYAPGEWHFAHDYAPHPSGVARSWFSDEEIAASLDALAAAQLEDGGWQIRWRRWAPGTELEARPRVTIDALRTLRAYGR
ncbi:hypothetical protein [Saccharopolyspora sp. NPDC002578]